MINNSNAIIISAGIIASAIILGSFVALHSTSPISSVTNAPNPLPSGKLFSSQASSPLVPVSPTATITRPITSSVTQTDSFTPTPASVPTPVSTNPVQISTIRSVNSSISPLPVKSSTEPLVIQRPETDSFIQNYYGKLKDAQYESAWQDLSVEFQNDRSANPGGYSGEYLKWWSSYGQRTRVGKIETVKLTPERAIVHAHCRFQGKAYIAQYLLQFDESSQSWKIDKIKKLS